MIKNLGSCLLIMGLFVVVAQAQKPVDAVKSSEFGRYAAMVARIKTYVTIDNPELIDLKGYDAAIINSNPSQWKRDDIMNMARSSFGFVSFEALTTFASNALVVNKDGTAFTTDALCAQNALKEFLPADLTLLDYIKMLGQIQTQTKERRLILRKQLKDRIDKIDSKHR